MEVTHSTVDLAACFAANQKPHAIIERGDHEWLVSYDAIRMDAPIGWSQTIREGDVYIPLVPYMLAQRADLALAFMMQLGIRVSLDVGRPVERLHLVTGFPVDEEWRYYLGFAIVLGR